MFCILSKNKNGTESAIAYFDTYEKAENAIPIGASSWYVKEIGELKPFLETLKIKNKGKYVVYDDDVEITKYKKEKVILYDNEHLLKQHSCKAIVKKEEPKKEPVLIDKLPQNTIPPINKKEILSKYTYDYQKPIKEKKEIQPIKHLDPIKKMEVPPTEEDGKNWYRYSFYFMTMDSTPSLIKSYEGKEPYTTRTFVQEGYIYKDKGFHIVVYALTSKEAHIKMKEKLKELKKSWK